MSSLQSTHMLLEPTTCLAYTTNPNFNLSKIQKAFIDPSCYMPMVKEYAVVIIHCALAWQTQVKGSGKRIKSKTTCAAEKSYPSCFSIFGSVFIETADNNRLKWKYADTNLFCLKHTRSKRKKCIIVPLKLWLLKKHLHYNISHCSVNYTCYMVNTARKNDQKKRS